MLLVELDAALAQHRNVRGEMVLAAIDDYAVEVPEEGGGDVHAMALRPQLFCPGE
jgi:hypothetical protein